MTTAVAKRETMIGTETGLVEVGSSALVAQAKTAVEARYTMAFHRPRNEEMFRANLLDRCKSPAFADVAFYAKPIGGSKVWGWSIRFAETAARLYKNMEVKTSVVYDDDTKRGVRVCVSDLEANCTVEGEFVLEKVVERRSASGRTVLRERKSADGSHVVFTVLATEDELLTKQNALVSKYRRQGILQLLPGDILEEAKKACAITRRSEQAEDPKAYARKLIDEFRERGISPEEVQAYVGKQIDLWTADDLESLALDVQSMDAGDGVTWTDLREARHGSPNRGKGEGEIKATVIEVAHADEPDSEVKAVEEIKATANASGKAKGKDKTKTEPEPETSTDPRDDLFD